MLRPYWAWRSDGSIGTVVGVAAMFCVRSDGFWGRGGVNEVVGVGVEIRPIMVRVRVARNIVGGLLRSLFQRWC